MSLPRFRIVRYRMIVVELISGDGHSEGGISVQFHRHLANVLGRVVDFDKDCFYVRKGDLVFYPRNATDCIPCSAGKVRIISETRMLGVIERADGSPWFQEEEQETSRLIAGA